MSTIRQVPDMKHGRKVMILGASRGQLGLYEAAARMGIATIAAGVRGNYPGLSLADEIVYIDIEDESQVVEAAGKYGADAIATSCHDIGLKSLGAAVDELGFVGLTHSAACASVDKLLQKKLLLAAGVPTARAVEIRSLNEIDKAYELFNGAVVIKRVRGQGSSGVSIVSNKSDIDSTIDGYLIQDGQCLVEEYMDGLEFGAQALIQNGKIAFIMPHHDLLTDTVPPMPIGHGVPLAESYGDRQEISKVIEVAISALGFDNCAVNIDLMLHNGKVKIIELTGRAGANGLPELVGALFNRNYYEDILHIAYGDGVAPEFKANEVSYLLVKLIASKREGQFQMNSFEGSGDPIVAMRCFLNEGDTYPSFKSLKDCFAEILVRGKGLEECIAAIEDRAESLFGISSSGLV